MDRAAKLAAEARDLIEWEKRYRHSGEAWSQYPRFLTRWSLYVQAARYGFAPNEIPDAVSQALTDAGVGR